MSKALATIETNAPIEVSIEDITYSGPNMEDVSGDMERTFF